MPEVRKLANGDHQLGAVIEGQFVPFLTLSAGKIAQHVQRAEILAERAKEGDALAQDQIGKPIGAGSQGSGVTTKTTIAELDAHAAEHGIADYPAEGTRAEKLAAIQEYEAGEEG